MTPPIPEHQSNAETFKEEPVCIFTDKAIVPPRRQNGLVKPLTADAEKAPTPPAEGPGDP